MKYYYSTNGVDQNGPLTFEELKREGITAETLIWHKGMNEWRSIILRQQIISTSRIHKPTSQNIEDI